MMSGWDQRHDVEDLQRRLDETEPVAMRAVVLGIECGHDLAMMWPADHELGANTIRQFAAFLDDHADEIAANEPLELDDALEDG
jgi:hypothetical protein